MLLLSSNSRPKSKYIIVLTQTLMIKVYCICLINFPSEQILNFIFCRTILFEILNTSYSNNF